MGKPGGPKKVFENDTPEYQLSNIVDGQDALIATAQADIDKATIRLNAAVKKKALYEAALGKLTDAV